MKSLLIFLVILLFGCQLAIHVDVPETPEIAVDGVFNPDNTWSVKLSLSRHILYNPNMYDEELIDVNEIKEVTIRDENNVVVEALRRDKSLPRTIYRGIKKPESNKLYQIEIKTNSYGTLTASGKAPLAVPITSAKIQDGIEDSQSDFGGDRHSSQMAVKEVTVEFSDNGNGANFYEMYLVRQYEYEDHSRGSGKKTKKRNTETVPFTISDPSYKEKVNNNNSLVFDDRLFNGKQAKFILKTKNDNNVNQVVLRSITEDLYKLILSKQAQGDSGEGDPFSEPVLIPSNVKNGHGIFSGFSMFVYSL